MKTKCFPRLDCSYQFAALFVSDGFIYTLGNILHESSSLINILKYQHGRPKWYLREMKKKLNRIRVVFPPVFFIPLNRCILCRATFDCSSILFHQ